MKLIFLSAGLPMLLATAAGADFSYQESTKVTGGMMMQSGGAAPKPQIYITYVKGNRMARISSEHGQITDLDKETITNVNYANKTYSVTTFAQMKAMIARMGAGKNEPGAANISSHETGKTRTIGKVTAKETVLTVKLASSEIDTDVWLAPKVPGYDEVRQFQQRMAQKMGSAGANGIQKTVQEAAIALTRANGVPMLRTASIRGGMPAGGGGKSVLETSTELTALSSAAVDSSKFDIPAGFQKKEVGMVGTPPRVPQSPQSKPAHQ